MTLFSKGNPIDKSIFLGALKHEENTCKRVMVLVHDASSEYTLQMYEVSLKYL